MSDLQIGVPSRRKCRLRDCQIDCASPLNDLAPKMMKRHQGVPTDVSHQHSPCYGSNLPRQKHGYQLAVLQFPANLAEACLIFATTGASRQQVIQMLTGASLTFENFTLDLERLCLHGPSGQFHFRKKSFDVLRYLARTRPRRLSAIQRVNSRTSASAWTMARRQLL